MSETMTSHSRSYDIDQLSDAINSLQKSLACTICLELMVEPIKTRCGHSFCKSCIGNVLRKKNVSCPLCKKSLNRRNVSKDDHLQICIEKFKKLVTAIEIDSHIDILSYLKQPRDTKESCCYPDTRQSSRDSNKEKSSKKERSTRQSHLNANKQTDKPSTSHETIDNPRYDSIMSKEKPETLSSLSCAVFGDENDNAIHSPPDIKVRTWIHSLLNADDWTAGNEIPIEDKARPMNPISEDNDKSDETSEVRYDESDTSRSQDKKRNTDCSERIDEDNMLSQVNKEARQIGEVMEMDFARRELKYNASHARVRAKESHKKIARWRSDIERTVNQDNSSSAIIRDRNAMSASPSLSTTSASAITEQSTANWSRVIEFGKEMKRARKRKVKKLNVSTEKKKKRLQIIEDIRLSPNSIYDSIRIAAYDKSRKEANVSNRSETNVSNRLESNNRKQDATDKSVNLSDKVKLLRKAKSPTELYDKDKNDSLKSTSSIMNSSYITLEEDRIHIMNLDNDQMRKIIGIENAAENSQCFQNRCEENSADYCDSLVTPQKRLTVLTPEKLNESVEAHEIIHDGSQTSADFRSSSCLSTKKGTPEDPRETNNVRRTSSGAASRSSTPSRLSLRRKPETGNKDSPLLSNFPLSYRLSIGEHEDIGDHKNVNLSVSMGNELFNRLKVVRRDLNFKIIRKDQLQTDRDTISASRRVENINTTKNNDGKVSRIVYQDGKSNRNFTDESTVSNKSVLTKSRNVENQGARSSVKFMQMGTLVRRRNIKYFLLGTTKHELSMPAEVPVTPVYNMQLLISKSEATSFTPWNDSQSVSIVVEHISPTNNSNPNQAVSKEFPTTLPMYEASATSKPEKDMDSHLNRKKSATIVHSSNANQRADKSIEKVAEASARPFHKMSRADEIAIRRTISHTHPGTSNSIKLLSPDKDSQLKFLTINSPMSEREELRRASSIKSAIKGNNFSEMESSRLKASTLDKMQEPFIGSSYKKKRMRCANDRELFEDGSSDGNDDSVSVSSRTTIKLDRKLSKKKRSNRLDMDKRCLSSIKELPDDQGVDAILSISEEQDAIRKKFKISSLDTESKSTNAIKNLKRSRDDHCTQPNASITDTAAKKYSTTQEDEDHHVRSIIDEWTDEHDLAQKKLTKESKNSQKNVKSMKSPHEENSAGHQSSNAFKIEKHTNTKSSQKSSAKESDMFESNSLFNSENLDYILQQQPTNLNADDTSKKLVDSSNDDIINRVLQIDRSRNNPASCRSSGFTSRNDITNQREKISAEYLLQDNFDEIIASVEQPQSEDFISCTEQSNRNPNRPLAKQKTSNCLAMTDESFGAVQETPIIPPSSTNDMFDSPRNVRSSATNTISRNSDKENVACSQKRYGYVGDQRDRKDVSANTSAIDKDPSKKIVSKHNVSRETEKLLEERNASTSRLHVDDDEKATTAGNRSNSKDDTFGHDSLINITQHQAQLQMFEDDLFDIADRNQTRATKMTSQDDPSSIQQRTPRKRKQTSQAKNTELGECFADEDDVVENTPEKKMKNSGKSRESTKTRFLSPISKTSEWTPTTSGQDRIVRPLLNSASTPIPFEMCPSAQSTPIVVHNSVVNHSDSVFGGSKRTECIESGSILLANQVDTKTPENVRRQPERDLYFVCSGLSSVQITIVKEFATKYNANYVDQFDRNVTHVIVTTDEQNAAKSTLKYLQGIAHRKWIVSYRWIEDCIKQQKLLDEVPYEATTQNDGINGPGPRNSRLREKDLFEGFTFLCVGPYDNVSPSQYQDLLLATGATVVNSFKGLVKKEGMKGVVIQDNIHDDKTIEHWYRTTKAAPILVDWIVECIGQYKLFKLAPYILSPLSPQDFSAIGYPRELVEEDEEYSDDE